MSTMSQLLKDRKQNFSIVTATFDGQNRNLQTISNILSTSIDMYLQYLANPWYNTTDPIQQKGTIFKSKFSKYWKIKK